jgi:16S rRNA (cytosine1402-N4)-methyltransferase
MTMGSGGPFAAGGLARHVPVLARQVLEFLSPGAGGIYVDGTFGAGGHTRAILDAADCRVIGIDRDRGAIAGGASLAERYAGRLMLAQERFSRLDDVARGQGFPAVDGVLLDLGVSSMQLDEAARGFSFRLEGPLDMRMGADGPSAADVVAAAAERDLSRVIATLGEERHARSVARAIVAARRERPIVTTGELAAIVARVARAKPNEIHPATRTFQALRILVNDELAEIAAALAAAERVLKPGGRLAVIAFHSLEDRIVKGFLAERGTVMRGSRHQPEMAAIAPSLRVLTKRPLVADDAEVAANPRARSAKLRAAQRTEAAAHKSDPSALLPRVPALDDIMRRR